MDTRAPRLEQLSPLPLEDELIRHATDQSQPATHEFLSAGCGNPNWIATTPRDASFRPCPFGLAESRRVWNEPDLGGIPGQKAIAGRFKTFLSTADSSPGGELLSRSSKSATSVFGVDADAFVCDSTDAVIGDNDPEPDRIFVHAACVVPRFLTKTMLRKLRSSKL
jgi:aspartate 4-decarboxylase